MVSGNGNIISDGIHEVNQGFTSGHGADGFTLNRITIIHQQDIVLTG